MRVLTISLLLLGATTTQTGLPDSISSRLTRDLEPFVQERAAADEFSGTVVVAKAGEPIFAKAYGQADQGRHIPNTVDTRFNLGSVNKMFTAVSIAQLVEGKAIALDQPFGRYLRDYPNRAVADHVTVEQLLSHTSGMGDYFGPSFHARRTSVATVADLLPFFVNDPLSFAPGSRFQYSNAGYVVLGLLIEQASGERYADYLKGHVFAPAGMTDTSLDKRTGSGNLAIGYTHPPGPDGRPSAGARIENSDIVEATGSPAGGAFSTAHDLTAFSRALWAGKLIGLPLVAEFTKGHVPMGPIMYGFGFGTFTQGAVRIVGHNGGAPGVNVEFDMYPDQGYDVVVLANYDPPAALPVIQKTREILTGAVVGARPVPSSAPVVATSGLADYAGQFGDRTITVRDGHLYLQRAGGPVHTLVAISPDLFASEQMPDARFQFNRDAGGHVTELRVRLPDGTWETVRRTIRGA